MIPKSAQKIPGYIGLKSGFFDTLLVISKAGFINGLSIEALFALVSS